MSEILFELNPVLLSVAGTVCLLAIWWVASRAPGRWFVVILLGIVVAGVGAAALVVQFPELRNPQSAGGGNAAPGPSKRQKDPANSSVNQAGRRSAPAASNEDSARRKALEAKRLAEDEAKQRAAESSRKEEAARRRAEQEQRQAAERERQQQEAAELTRQRTAAEKAAQDAREVAERARKEAERARSAIDSEDKSGDKDRKEARSLTQEGAPQSHSDNRSAGSDVKTAPNGGAAEANASWHVVPVFYGTDRNRTAGEKRIKYTADRGKRLEVGRALVTVPKLHKVPNIERPWAYKVPLLNVVIFKEKEDPEKHFTMQELKHLTQEEFAALARARIAQSKSFAGQAVVFVHGFNTSFDYAVYRVAQLSYDLKFDGGAFVYSWPSRGEVSLVGYRADRESAEQAATYLEQFLTLVSTQTGATSVTVIAHSLGNKLLLPVLQKFKLRNTSDVKISQIILAAPDVDRDTFSGLAREIEGLVKGSVTLYAASNDLALDASRQFWGGVARAGDVPEEGPIVINGVDTIDVTSTSTDIFSLNHAGYAQSKTLLGDIRSLLTNGYRPPKVRNSKLLQRMTPNGPYWKYP